MSSFDVHPPLFFLLEFYWIQLFGESEFATRALPAIFGLFLLFIAFLIARKTLSGNNIYYYLILIATSPFFLFYTRMTRYYSLTGLLCLLTLLLFLRMIHRNKIWNCVLFWLSSLALIYTDYVGFVFLFCLGLYYFWIHRHRPKYWLWFLLGFILLFIGYLPWISNLLQGASAGTAPYPVDRGQDTEQFRLIGFIVYNAVQTVVRIFYTLYNFTLGETVFPWNPLILLGLVGSGLLFINAFRYGEGKRNFWFFSLILPFTLYILAVIFYSKVFSAANFALLPSKMFFLQPLWMMFLLRGKKRERYLKIGTALLLVFNLISLVNYHRGSQFLNPKYLVPWREVAQDIQTKYKQGDLVVTDESPLLHYLKDTPVNCYGLVGAVKYITELKHPMNVYLAIRYRGEESIYFEGVKVKEQLTEQYGKPDIRGYVPFQGLQRKIWKRLMGKEIDYYLKVFIFSVS